MKVGILQKSGVVENSIASNEQIILLFSKASMSSFSLTKLQNRFHDLYLNNI